MNAPQELAALIEQYRDRCLWFLRADYAPNRPEEMLYVLELIERYGDREAYRRAEEIKAWLLPRSKAIS